MKRTYSRAKLMALVTPAHHPASATSRVAAETAAQEPILLTLPYPPSANRYWRVWRGRVRVSAEATEYKAKVAWLIKRAKVCPLVGPLVVSVAVYRPRKVGDLDNTLKILLDSLQGYCFENDSQIVELHMRRSEGKENPRVAIKIEAENAQGI